MKLRQLTIRGAGGTANLAVRGGNLPPRRAITRHQLQVTSYQSLPFVISLFAPLTPPSHRSHSSMWSHVVLRPWSLRSFRSASRITPVKPSQAQSSLVLATHCRRNSCQPPNDNFPGLSQRCPGSAPAPGVVFRALAENARAPKPIKRPCQPRAHSGGTHPKMLALRWWTSSRCPLPGERTRPACRFSRPRGKRARTATHQAFRSPSPGPTAPSPLTWKVMYPNEYPGICEYRIAMCPR